MSSGSPTLSPKNKNQDKLIYVRGPSFRSTKAVDQDFPYRHRVPSEDISIEAGCVRETFSGTAQIEQKYENG